MDIYTQISLSFSYNGKLKKGNYFFKFAGVLQEPNFETTQNYADETIWSIDKNKTEESYMKIYNERRNMNITGKVALVQINILDDINVFCDKKYDDSTIKNEYGDYLTCGEGKFYEVENGDEITQYLLGINYFFDYNRSVYIKCHEKCKTCSKEYNETNMNCDECHENYFLRNGICLVISNCGNNYYYDNDLSLKCLDRETSCPDFKPYEDNITKECIKDCNIDEFNDKCNPTNNLISINETYNEIIDNIDYLNIQQKLLKNKEKYIILGNNVTFIFSTTEIETEELYKNNKSSTIILPECEKILKKNYSIPDEVPIPILKIETFSNYSDNMEVHYDLFNPLNLSTKLDLNICFLNYVEIRIPMNLKQYKMDLIMKTKNLGYNIFDLNDSFYNDICSVFTYNDSDISLSERKSLLDLSDENFCMTNCIPNPNPQSPLMHLKFNFI